MTRTQRAKNVRLLVSLLRDMYKDAGMACELRPYAPGTDREEFAAAARRDVEAAGFLPSGGLVVVTTAPEIIRHISKQGASVTGAVVFVLTRAGVKDARAILSDVRASVQGFKVHLQKEHIAQAPSTACVVCMEDCPKEAMQCMACFERVCYSCVARIALLNGDPMHACPTCSRRIVLTHGLSLAPRETLHEWPSMAAALRAVLKRSKDAVVPIVATSAWDVVPGIAFAGRRGRAVTDFPCAIKVVEIERLLVGECPQAGAKTLGEGIVIERIDGAFCEVTPALFKPYSVLAARELGLAPVMRDDDADSDESDESE